MNYSFKYFYKQVPQYLYLSTNLSLQHSLVMEKYLTSSLCSFTQVTELCTLSTSAMIPLAQYCIYSFIYTIMIKKVSRRLTQRNGVHAHTEGVETSVTLVTEHHRLLMVRLLAHGARLALHALPGIHLDLGHQLHTHVQAGRVTWTQTQASHLLHYTRNAIK